ncbi:MAG: NAD(P)H-dependent glycerol-3-phosphate dehydrogenase [Spirochaetes bacterium]|nr:NAD(P)H-dependent glycerol-3-phosphate dehydrogenase [Spirochaetota bacterium]
MNQKIAVIGAGSWGTCIAQVIAENNPDYQIKLWAYEKHVVKSINERHENSEYLPNIALSQSIVATGNLREAVEGIEGIIFGTPSKVILEIAQRVKKHLPHGIPVAYLTKGFCRIHDEILTISMALSKIMPEHAEKIVAISGPSHAEEVSKKFHTCLLVAGKSPEARRYFCEILHCEYLECREHEDIIGVELGGTLKNPAAIAAGMLSVLPNCGDNLAGALMTEALKEMCMLGDAFGAKRETMLDISGLGDLIATALSEHSRNRRFGKDIARQIMKTGSAVSFYDRIVMRFKPEYVLEKMSRNLHYLAEGAYAIEPLIEFAQKKRIEIPVYRALYEVLLNNRSARLLIETIKNPARFQMLLDETRIRAGMRKKGMERAKGTIFIPMILKKIKNYINTNGNAIAFSEMVQKRHTPLAVFADEHRFSLKERRAIAIIENNPSPATMEELSKLYIKEFIDCFNPLVWRLFIFLLTVRNAMLNAFRRDTSKPIFSSNLRVTGLIREVRNVAHSANVVYLATFRNYLDFLFIMMAIGKFNLIPPRFLVNSILIDSSLRKFVVRRSGGYIVNIQRLGNPLYRETIKAYLTTLLEHGVPVLFFPELLFFKDGSLREMSGEFIEAVVELLKRNTEEIALIPVTISYYKRPVSEVYSGKKFSWSQMLRNTVHINFSKPIMVSDYSHRDNALAIITTIVKDRWKRDSFVFPHYLFCAILKKYNYAIHMNEARAMIRNILPLDDRLRRYSDREIFTKGISFLTTNGIGSVEGKMIRGTAREEVDYYASLYGELPL